MKRLISLLYLLASLFTAGQVSAASEFTTNLKSSYTVEASGLTSVTHEISLQNNLAHIYATSYTLSINSDELTSISARDEIGALEVSSEIKDGLTTMNVALSRPKIGKDQTKTILITYKTQNIAEIIGDTKTINIPRLGKANEAESYTRIVRIEGIGNQKSLIYPPPQSVSAEGKFTQYSFVGHQNDSLSLIFGESVTYELGLTYELKNKELSSSVSELALPPDTGYQHVVLSKVTPSPSEIVVDQDGNWLARYPLKSQEKILVKATLFVTIYPEPILYDPSKSEISSRSESKYWNQKASIVESLATQLKTPENIYSYLTDSFTYNYAGASQPNTRLGAEQALLAPTNLLCTEFTDSFVALGRALGIPTREINGYGYTSIESLYPQNQSSDILHAWPEYFDREQKRWIAVDPTWGTTTGGIDYFNKLDFNHITFVRHGAEDSYPLPAGAYKSSPDDKYVEVKVAADIPASVTSFDIKDLDDHLVIVNTGSSALVNETITHEGREYKITYLPPFGQYELNSAEALSFWNKFALFFTKLATWLRIR